MPIHRPNLGVAATDRVSAVFPRPNNPLCNTLWPELDRSKMYIAHFIQDLSYSAFPRSAESRGWLNITGGTPEDQINFLRLLGARSNTPSEALTVFARKILPDLVVYRKVHLEIVKTATGEVGLARVAPHYSFCFFGNIIQYIPKQFRGAFDGRIFVFVPKAKILSIKLPLLLRMQVGKLFKFLWRYSDHAFLPKFYRENMNENTSFIPHVSNYKDVMDLALAKACKQIGWHARRSDKKELEFYAVTRLLRFAEFKLRLRSCIIDALNECIRTTGLINGNAQFISHLFPKMSDITKARRELGSGDHKLDQLAKSFF